MGHKEYNKNWMRVDRLLKSADTKRSKLIRLGRCPNCEIKLSEAPNHDCLSSGHFPGDN